MKLLRITIVLMVFLIASCAEEVIQEVETDQSTPLNQFEIEEKVWAQNPGASRNTVIFALKNASDLYPSRNNNFGWGRIDAQQAVNNM